MASIIFKNKRWVNGIVPFAFDKLDFPDKKGKIAMGIQDAIDEWNSHGLKVQLKERTSEPTFLLFKINSYTESGGSNVGMGFGIQIIWATRKPQSTRSDIKSLMLHEIGHAIGLHHEACRHDRDNFIDIDFSNIQHLPLTSYYENQFDIEEDGKDFGEYDFKSIMHYGPLSYAIDESKPTITGKDGNVVSKNTELSAGDVEAIRALYSDIDKPPIIINMRSFHEPNKRRIIQPPSITVDPPPITIAPPSIHIVPGTIHITPDKITVRPQPVRFMGQNIPVPTIDVQPPSIAVSPPAIDIVPDPLTIDPPPITVTPPPIVLV